MRCFASTWQVTLSSCCSSSVRSSGDKSDNDVKDSSGPDEEEDDADVQRARQVRAKSEHREDRYSVSEEVCAGVLALVVASAFEEASVS